MEPIEGSETSGFKPQTPGKYPKENILHNEHGESLKSRHYEVNSSYEIQETYQYLFGEPIEKLCVKYRKRIIRN